MVGRAKNETTDNNGGEKTKTTATRNNRRQLSSLLRYRPLASSISAQYDTDDGG